MSQNPPMPEKEIRTRLRTRRGPFVVETERETFAGVVIKFVRRSYDVVTFKNEDTGVEVPCFVGEIGGSTSLSGAAPFARRTGSIKAAGRGRLNLASAARPMPFLWSSPASAPIIRQKRNRRPGRNEPLFEIGSLQDRPGLLPEATVMTVAGKDTDQSSATPHPTERPAGYQRWHDLLFLHWRISPAEIGAQIPEPLSVDTYRRRRLGRPDPLLDVGRASVVVAVDSFYLEIPRNERADLRPLSRA